MPGPVSGHTAFPFIDINDFSPSLYLLTPFRMPRVKAILQSEYPYHITARCINREWFNIPMPLVWQIFCEELNETKKQKTLLIHSFVLMTNHFHLIASTPNANISECMHHFMGRTSRRLTSAGNRINETFAGRHYKCILGHHNYYLNAYKYIYRNPVAAKICQRAEQYPYSTLPGKLGLTNLLIKTEKDFLLSKNPNETVKWLNTEPDPQKLEGVRFGLKRPYFKSKKDPSSKKSLITDSEVL